MGQPQSKHIASDATPHRFLPVLLLLFVGSGCAALIYEIVWFQLLQLVIGSSAVSLGVLLGTFMGGMCLGSLALPRLVPTHWHPLKVYALLELSIGVIGIAVLFAMPLVDRLYVAIAGHGAMGIVFRAVVCVVCLLPPTLAMGATLPAIARWIETTPQGVSWLGFFYAGNIAGAVFGCLLAGFYLLRVHDMAMATYVAAAINGGVALIGLSLAALAPTGPPTSKATQDHSAKTSEAWPVYGAIALSGLCALGAEVLWTRLLSLMLGATVYTFSIILAVFLIGLGIGSCVGAVLARGQIRPQMLLGWCQALLAAAIAWTAFILTQSLPYWPIEPTLSRSPWYIFQLDLLRCVWAVLPAAFLWGASFPLALAAVATRDRDPGRLVGSVYAANTIGAIIGAVSFSVLLIAWIGTQQSQRLLIGLSAVAAVLAFLPLVRTVGSSAGADRQPSELPLGIAILPAATVGLAALLAWTVPEIPWGLVAYGRSLPVRFNDIADGKSHALYVGEGMNSSVAVTEDVESKVRNFHVSGKVEASSEPQDMRLQRMLGHLPALVHPKPKSVLIVGCGAGVTAGSFVVHPDIERIVICEIEPLIPQVVARFFGDENHSVLTDSRHEIVYDDARHYMLTSKETFDVITSDPIHPWVKGAATLYTKEYFDLCLKRLNAGGVITQWVPLYESNSEVVKSEVATFMEAFPNGTVWSNDINGRGYDIVLLGQAGPTKIDVDELQQRLDRPDHLHVARSLREVGLGTALELLATYAGQGTDLAPWLKDAEINRDRNLRLQYLAGLGLNVYRSERIYDEMLAYRKYPDNLFVTAELTKIALQRALKQIGPDQ